MIFLFWKNNPKAFLQSSPLKNSRHNSEVEPRDSDEFRTLKEISVHKSIINESVGQNQASKQIVKLKCNFTEEVRARTQRL